jgi:hypothetical protein
MDVGDELARRGFLLTIVAIIATTAGMVISLNRYTLLGMVRVYTSGMFALIMVWSYGISQQWTDEVLIFTTGSACLFADYVLVGLLNVVKAVSADPLTFLDKWRGK